MRCLASALRLHRIVYLLTNLVVDCFSFAAYSLETGRNEHSDTRDNRIEDLLEHYFVPLSLVVMKAGIELSCAAVSL